MAQANGASQTKTAMKLEAAETKLIKLANTARIKAAKKGGVSEAQPTDDAEGGEESGSVAARYIPASKRPTHRLKPLIGKKVDTINWSRYEIERLNPLIEQEQRNHKAGEANPLHAVFVEFYDQTEAQAAFQMVQAIHKFDREKLIGICRLLTTSHSTCLLVLSVSLLAR